MDFRTKSFGLDIEPSSQVCISDDRTAKERECTYLEEEFHKMIGTSSHSRRMKCDLQQNSPESGNERIKEPIKLDASQNIHRNTNRVTTELQLDFQTL